MHGSMHAIINGTLASVQLMDRQHRSQRARARRSYCTLYYIVVLYTILKKLVYNPIYLNLVDYLHSSRLSILDLI